MANNYNVRKISDLDPAESLADGDLFYLSQFGDGGSYSSKRLEYKTLSEGVVSAAVAAAQAEFGIPDGVSVKDSLLDKLGAMLSGESRLSSVVFAETPAVEREQDVGSMAGNELVTRAAAEALVDRDKSYVSEGSRIDCRPRNAEGYTRYAKGVMEWHFNHGGRDSSDYVPQSGATTAGYAECQETGLLVAYGWLADNGGVLPEECWVGLFGKVRCLDAATGEYVEEDIALAVQPWVVGANSQVAQYVGFQLPVKKGMKLKIKTGFNVNGLNSGFGRAHSLMLNDPDAGGNMPNTFVGYILH